MNWLDSVDYKIFWMLALPGGIFLKAYFVVKDFWDIVFLKKSFIPHMDAFFRAPYSCYFAIFKGWPWMDVGCEICTFCSCIFRFSKQEHQSLSWQSLIFFWKLKLYTVVLVHCICKTKQSRWPFDWKCALCCSAMFQFLV